MGDGVVSWKAKLASVNNGPVREDAPAVLPTDNPCTYQTSTDQSQTAAIHHSAMLTMSQYVNVWDRIELAQKPIQKYFDGWLVVGVLLPPTFKVI